MNNVSAGYYTYVRQTDTNGVVTVHQYRCWDHNVLLASLSDAAEEENRRARKEQREAKAVVVSISEEEYLAKREWCRA